MRDRTFRVHPQLHPVKDLAPKGLRFGPHREPVVGFHRQGVRCVILEQRGFAVLRSDELHLDVAQPALEIALDHLLLKPRRVESEELLASLHEVSGQPLLHRGRTRGDRFGAKLGLDGINLEPEVRVLLAPVPVSGRDDTRSRMSLLK